MSLIEGSDLQSLMQKHEMDIEVLRKEHAREIDRVKLDQETEQKNLIGLLQRNNSSLESKCDKLQAHIKTLEVRIKDLIGTIDNKNRLLNEREEAKIRSDAEFQRLLDIANEKANSLSQEKEHLRHKVIRLNLDARGEGENTIENMLKRISRASPLLDIYQTPVVRGAKHRSHNLSETRKSLRKRRRSKGRLRTCRRSTSSCCRSTSR
ncbi:MAG: hypothetical protein BJ554DRAFT_1117 [Olpidium bornovanus]|uniref:Uncharacterized protein n=1 Tax=Olpidium bornovanus TaxID=278681 RepID=A0A8H7ZSM6_9FUNG|nr:MAG: hypothetical protein BJ554DRAFT_1117 [Olpidium bornovanus]